MSKNISLPSSRSFPSKLGDLWTKKCEKSKKIDIIDRLFMIFWSGCKNDTFLTPQIDLEHQKPPFCVISSRLHCYCHFVVRKGEKNSKKRHCQKSVFDTLTAWVSRWKFCGMKDRSGMSKDPSVRNFKYLSPKPLINSAFYWFRPTVRRTAAARQHGEGPRYKAKLFSSLPIFRDIPRAHCKESI